MKKSIVLIFFIIFLFSCGEQSQQSKDYGEAKLDWQQAPKIYRCTENQIKRVHFETKWCNDNTDYINTYCYGMAFIRNCKKENIK